MTSFIERNLNHRRWSAQNAITSFPQDHISNEKRTLQIVEPYLDTFERKH